MNEAEAPIVVPLDGSRNAENAVPLAASLAAMYGDCPVHFLTVADPQVVHTPDAVAHEAGVFDRHVRNLAEKHRVRCANSQLVTAVWLAEAILRYTSTVGARFLVIATHGRGGSHATFIGSVADKVCRAARVPLFVVPGVETPAEPPEGPVIIALDGSAEAESALTLGRDVAARMNAKVQLLRAFRVPPPPGIDFSYYSPDVLDRLHIAAREYLDEIALGDEGKIVVQASPALAIEGAAHRLDARLIVMASHGKGRFHRVALGSTTDRVLHSARRTLLIVPCHREAGVAV